MNKKTFDFLKESEYFYDMYELKKIISYDYVDAHENKIFIIVAKNKDLREGVEWGSDTYTKYQELPPWFCELYEKAKNIYEKKEKIRRLI